MLVSGAHRSPANRQPPLRVQPRVPGHADGFILDDGEDHVGGTIVITAPEFTVGEGCGAVFIAADRFEVTDQVECEGLLVLDLERRPAEIASSRI